MLPRSLRSLFLILLLMGLARPGAAQSSPVFDPANGHWYQAVIAPGGIAWGDALKAAQVLSYAGYPGHLVTITTPQENEFILDNLPLPQKDQWWIGAFQDHSAPDYREQLRSPRWGKGLRRRHLPDLKNPEMNPTSRFMSVLVWLSLAALTFVLLVVGYWTGFWHLAP